MLRVTQTVKLDLEPQVWPSLDCSAGDLWAAWDATIQSPSPGRAFSWGFANLQRNRSLQLAWPVEIMTPVRLERYSTKFAEMSYIFTCRVSRLSIWIAYFRDISAIFTHVEDAKEEQEQPQIQWKTFGRYTWGVLDLRVCISWNCWRFAYHGSLKTFVQGKRCCESAQPFGRANWWGWGHRCRVLTHEWPQNTSAPAWSLQEKTLWAEGWVMFVGSMIGERRQHSNCQPSGSAVLAFCHNLHVGE